MPDLRWLPVVFASLAACSTIDDVGDDSDDGSAVAPCDGSGLGPGDYTRTETIDGLERSWSIHVPPGVDSVTPRPLVFNLHPFVLGGNDIFHEIWRNESGVEPLSDTEGFLVVQPEGTGGPAAWNAGEECCGEPSANGVDDVGFILGLIDRVSAEACVDSRRVYSTGMSNGGYLSHRLACEHPDRIAAIAPVVGSLSAELVCTEGRAVPVLIVSGSEDNLESREASATRWVEMNGCDPTPAVTEGQGPGAICRTWSGCDDGVDVTHCVVQDAGHCWFSDRTQITPGCGPVDFVSERVAWDFMSRWTLP